MSFLLSVNLFKNSWRTLEVNLARIMKKLAIDLLGATVERCHLCDVASLDNIS